jgi:alkylated DNA repair dioxygenase AlkB
MALNGKLLKKIRRKQAQFQTNEPEMGVRFLDELPAITGDLSVYHFFIGNGGTRSGLSCEVLTALLDGVDTLYMPESKDFSFASVTGETKATELLRDYNGLCVQGTCKARNISHLLTPVLLQGPPLHLYLSIVDNIPASVSKFDVARSFALPPGLILFPEFISLAEERELLSYFTSSTSRPRSEVPLLNDTVPNGIAAEGPKDSEISFSVPRTTLATVSTCSLPILPVSSTLKHRSVRHYGYEFIYGRNTVDADLPLPGGLPDVCTPLLGKMISQEVLQWMPDQLTVNDYLPGAGIPPHVDTHSPFEDRISSLSLGSQVVMDFRHPNGRKVAVFLPRRSLLVMTEESRYLWSHGSVLNVLVLFPDPFATHTHANTLTQLIFLANHSKKVR